MKKKMKELNAAVIATQESREFAYIAYSAASTATDYAWDAYNAAYTANCKLSPDSTSEVDLAVDVTAYTAACRATDAAWDAYETACKLARKADKIYRSDNKKGNKK